MTYNQIKFMEYGLPNDEQVSKQTSTPVIDKKLINKILNLLKDSISLANLESIELVKLFPTKTAAGAYKLSTVDGDKFIRISSRLGNILLEQKIMNYLKKAGVSINEILVGGIEFDWHKTKFRLDVRPFLNGHLFNGSENDLFLAAKELKKLHLSLKNFPDSQLLKKNQIDLLNAHQIICIQLNKSLKNDDFELFFEKKNWAKKHKTWLLEVLDLYNPQFYNYANAQCLHGQPHTGNILFVNSQVVIFDLESSLYTFAPISWDLSYLFQRFCMADNPSDKILCRRLKIVQDGYGEVLPPLTEITRITSIFSIIAAIDYRLNKNISVPIEEFEKFRHLDLQAKSKQHILK